MDDLTQLLEDAVADVEPSDRLAEIRSATKTRPRSLPVQFRIGRNPTDTVFGVPTSEPITNQPQLNVLSLVSISDPVEGLQVRDSFVARGAASSFEGNVPWELRDAEGTVVESGAATAAMETHLVEWETGPIDVSGLEPGRYTFVATTDDAEFTDTRTVVVQ